MAHPCDVSRRGMFRLLAGAGLASPALLLAGSSDFWNKKEPDQWSQEEVDRLTTKSPWAKEVTASTPQYTGDRSAQTGGPGMGYPGAGGGRVGGMGIPSAGGGGGMGRGGMGSGRSRGGPSELPMQFSGIVRWESAKPIREALKTALPESLGSDFVISVSGIPILGNGRLRSDDGDTPTAVSKKPSEDALEQIKNLTYLEPKGKSAAQPGVVQPWQGTGAGVNTLLFGFSREILQLGPEDKEVTFKTRLGTLDLKVKFSLKDMMYHKELAL